MATTIDSFVVAYDWYILAREYNQPSGIHTMNAGPNLTWYEFQVVEIDQRHVVPCYGFNMETQ